MLCEHLSVPLLAAAMGISAGGHTAITLAAGYPNLVERLILQSTVRFVPWPDRLARAGAHMGVPARFGDSYLGLQSGAAARSAADDPASAAQQPLGRSLNPPC